jgi:hypothetical protein
LLVISQTESGIMGGEFAALADRAEHYRQLASIIRARAASMKSAAVRDELEALAADYEVLAKYAQSLSPGLPRRLANTG